MTECSSDPNRKLSFPTKPLELWYGTVEEYVIPEEEKKDVLEQLYIFSPVPRLNAVPPSSRASLADSPLER